MPFADATTGDSSGHYLGLLIEFFTFARKNGGRDFLLVTTAV